MHSPSIYSVVQADASLIKLVSLYKNCWKVLSRPSLKPSTVLVLESKQSLANSMFVFTFCLLNKTFIVVWYLKPLIWITKSLNKSMITGLVASNSANGSLLNL